jgi:hypothetical protein
MKKACFVFITIFSIASCQANIGLHDFYGAWLCEDGDGAEMTYIISEKTFTTKFNYLSVSRTTGLEILSWRKITNEDINTKNDYPTGFELEFKYHGETAIERLFLHHDKISLINSAESDYIYVKQ